MGGSNPYIQTVDSPTASKRFTITFKAEAEDETLEVNVDPNDIPYGETGLPGSILDIAMGAGLDVEHACGGVCACSTCHVIVTEGLETCPEPTEDEDDQLEGAPGLTLQSRLACQCVPNGEKNLVVTVPEWNINLVKESH